MNYGRVFNSFQEMYNEKPYHQYPIGADRFEEWVNQVNDHGYEHFGKALSTMAHTDQVAGEAGKAIRSGVDAFKEYRQGNKAGAKNRLGSSLAHAGKAAVKTAQLPLEIGKTAASRLAWYPRYGIDKFYREHCQFRGEE